MRLAARVARPALVAILSTIGLIVAILATAGPAYAATFTVNSTADEPDASPSDGLCAATPSGACTLRAAIMEANRAPGPTTITLPAGEYLLRRRASQPQPESDAVDDLDITSRVSIVGESARTTTILPAVTSESFFSSRLLEIGSTGVADISGVTLAGADTLGEAGAGIFNAGNLTLRNSVARNNRTGQTGGGLANSGTALLENVTIARNRATDLGLADFQYGGGLSNASTGTLTLRNVTVSDNSASGEGGGLVNNGTTRLTNVTLADNVVAPRSGTPRGHAIANPGVLEIQNSIISRTGGNQCSGQPPTSLGNNLESGDTCRLGGPNDRSNLDARLGPLGDNFGPTDTRALLPGSPAIDQAAGAACPPTDQRGSPRPRDGDGDGNAVCDIGAYELQVAAGPDLSVSFAGPSFPPPAVITGRTFRVDITVANDGVAAGTDVVVTIAHPGAALAGASGENLTCAPTSSTEARCTLGTIVVGQRQAIHLDLTAGPLTGAFGQLTLTAQVAAGQPETNTANNQVTRTVNIHPDPCSPRQPIRLTTERRGPGQLQVVLRVPSFTIGPTNTVRAVRLGPLSGGHVEYDGRSYAGGEDLVLRTNGIEVAFLLVRDVPGQVITLPLVVVDECGEWRTFVGGGPGAF